MRFSYRTVDVWVIRLFLINVFWYLSLFPGRLGFDYSLALKMIRAGESTDWWSGTFWRILEIFTFKGQTIALLSLLQITILAVSFNFFVESLPKLNTQRAKKAQLIFSATPIYGFFSLSISHDVFQTSALLLMVGYLSRSLSGNRLSKRNEFSLFSLTIIFLSTVKTGAILSLPLILFVLVYVSKKVQKVTALIVLTLFMNIVPSFGLDSTWTQSGKFTPFLGDMKCIAQHPDATITSDTWLFLESISSRKLWLEPVSCTGLEAAVEKLRPEFSRMKLNAEFLKHYFELIASNPEIFVMGHIVRSREALPPLLFPPPENQVLLDFDLPLGTNTNAELQSGPPLLHPSIDDVSVNQKISFLKPLEFLVQLPAFLVNQASWFWGWAGLWISIAVLILLRIQIFGNFSTLATVFSPLLFLHLIIIILAFNPQGRHLMASIWIGLYICIYGLLQFLKTQR